MSSRTTQSIRWRGGQVTRIEALTDAVFGFAITLLVVSLEVPQTFDDLMAMMRGFVAFAFSFTLLILDGVNRPLARSVPETYPSGCSGAPPHSRRVPWTILSS